MLSFIMSYYIDTPENISILLYSVFITYKRIFYIFVSMSFIVLYYILRCMSFLFYYYITLCQKQNLSFSNDAKKREFSRCFTC